MTPLVLLALGALQITSHRVLDGDPTRHEGFPRLIRAADGRLLLFTRLGTSHAQDPAVICLRSSIDDGATWTPRRELWRDPEGLCAHNPVAVLAPGGDVVLWCSRYDWRGNRRLPCLISRSSDHGATWAPFEIFDADPSRSVYYVTDAIGFGGGLVAVGATFRPPGVEPCWNTVWQSSDGVTWRCLAQQTAPDANLGDEVALADVNRRLRLLLRGRKRAGLFGYWSDDGGLSWSAEEDLGPRVGTLQRPFLTHLGGARWLLTGRQKDATPLEVVAYESRDGCHTFGGKVVLDTYLADGGYTSAVVRQDGAVLLAYYADHQQAGKPDIHLVDLRVGPE